MKKMIYDIIAWFFPTLMLKRGHLKERKKNDDFNSAIREEIIDYYKDVPGDSLDPQLKEGLDYIREKRFSVYPYSYIEKYKEWEVKVYTDEECGLKYVLHENKRLYFCRSWSEFFIQIAYSMYLREQDPLSPHCYQTKDFKVEKDDVIFDIGAAEGNFTLSVIETVKKAYLFETMEEWVEPLKKTFEPWKDKVEIIHKYVSDVDDENNVTLDKFTESVDAKSVWVKVDVEGAESRVIKGMEKMLLSPQRNVKATICTYHKKNDYEELSKIMKGLGYNVAPSLNYMLFIYGDTKLTPPYFRKGLIYCKK